MDPIQHFQVRLVSCPSKIRFIKSLMNLIDLLAILPRRVRPSVEHLDDCGWIAADDTSDAALWDG